MVGRGSRLGPFLGAIAAAVALIAVAASPAAAERSYEGAIAGFGNPHGVATDDSGNIWVSDTELGQITTHDPAGTVIATQTKEGQYPASPTYLQSIAVNSATDWLYVADSLSLGIDVFDDAGAFLEQWTGGFGFGYVRVAVDDSGGSTQGRVYVAASEAGVQAFDEDGDPVDFSGSAGYINGNQITETPNGPFGYVWNIAVDGEGNFYVLDLVNVAVYKFGPDGVYQQAFQDPALSGNLQGVAIDPVSENVLVVDQGNNVVHEFEPSGAYLEAITNPAFGVLNGGIAIDANGEVFVSDGSAKVVHRLGANTVLPKISYDPSSGETQNTITLNATIDPNEGGPVSGCQFEYGTDTTYGTTVPCDPATPPSYTTVTGVSADLTGLTTEQVYHYRVSATNANGTKKGQDRTFVANAVSQLATQPPTDVAPTSATLNGSWVGNGEDTDFFFEWGTDETYGNATPLEDGEDGLGATSESAAITGLSPITTYHYRIVAENSVGTTYGQDVSFKTPPNAPLVTEWVTDVHSDSARLWAEINPGGGATGYHFEYVDEAGFQAGGFDDALSVPAADVQIGEGLSTVTVNQFAGGLEPGTTYHFRVVATNSRDTTAGAGRTLTTFPYEPLLEDSCPNVLSRKQTSASLLLDCRSYELVSAADAGGYNVESSLIGGQTPYPGYPEASEPTRVLYTMFDGGIPNSGQPTNAGRDPYVATRGANGWSTAYVGIPADNQYAIGPFRSAVSDADSSLGAFAFAEPDVCSPCFAGGGTGIPIRNAAGQLVQGMVGSIPSLAPVAAGDVRKRFSADGGVFVFGSTTKLEPDGNDGQVSIYARDLRGGGTAVVSKTPEGETMTGAGIVALDVSRDGSRVLIGRLLGADAEGNESFHLYMNVGGAEESIDLTPGTTTGVRYAGMTSDGSQVLFTTRDALDSDADTSADLYRATVSGSGSNLAKVSTGDGAGDACDPTGDWNTPAAAPNNCDVVAIAGGGGVAAESGTAYFFSPELLDGSDGVAGEPNLYVAAPGSAPEHVVTLEPGNPAVSHAVTEAEKRSTADFQVTGAGDYAAFSSRLSLDPSVDNDGFNQVYRHRPAGDELDCASCAPTGVRSSADAHLAANGLSLSDDGDVFFTSGDPLAPRDLNGKPDVYQRKDGATQLISPGTSPYPSELLSASADGRDVYFFTRDNLAPQDENGRTIKIYDAREGGGFFVVPPPQPCAASDECHGPSSPAAPPPGINSQFGSGGQHAKGKKPKPRCRKNRKGKRVCKRGGKGKKKKKKAAADRRAGGKGAGRG